MSLRLLQFFHLPERACGGLVTRFPVRQIIFFLMIMGTTGSIRAAERISYIELYQKKHVTIHFDTKANRTYELQFLESLNCSGKDGESCSKSGVPRGLWTTLFVAPNLPFPSHYVFTDTRADRARFYRLKVTQ